MTFMELSHNQNLVITKHSLYVLVMSKIFKPKLELNLKEMNMRAIGLHVILVDYNNIYKSYYTQVLN